MSIDLAKLPQPTVIEQLSFEAVLAENLALLKQIIPDYEELESDDYMPLIEAFAYRELLLRQRINNGARAVMLPYAVGSDLDNLASFYNIERLIVDGELETDNRLRERVLLAFDKYSTAGSIDSYKLACLSASSYVKDVAVQSLTAGEVTITILSAEENGLASNELLQAVSDKVTADKVRPLTDLVIVNSAEIIEYNINATLFFYSGPTSELVKQTAVERLNEYVKNTHKLGHNIHVSAIHGALQVEGVQRVDLHGFSDLIIDGHQAAFCTGISVNNGGTDE